MNYLSHLTREEKIAALQKIARGEATLNDFKPKKYVFYLYEGPTVGSPGGLYADGQPTSDPSDLAIWKKACSNTDIPVKIEFFDPVGDPEGNESDISNVNEEEQEHP